MHVREKLATDNRHCEKKEVWQRARWTLKVSFPPEHVHSLPFPPWQAHVCPCVQSDLHRHTVKTWDCGARRTTKRDHEHAGIYNSSVQIFDTYSVKDVNSARLTLWVLGFFFLIFLLSGGKTRQNLWNGKVCFVKSLLINPGRLFGTLRDPEGVAVKGAVEHFGKRAAWAAAWQEWNMQRGGWPL